MVRKRAPLIGGRLCLDFVNTVSWRGTDEPRDHFDTFADLVRWAEHAGALPRRRARAVRRIARSHPRQAQRALTRARALRDAMHRIMVAWKKATVPRACDRALLNGCAPPRKGIDWRRGEVVWSTGASPGLESVLWPIVWSAADLLIGGERRRLRSCGSRVCGWLFYDESRGNRRRWCSMSDCGNRAKARRFYARERRERR
jgi:predicted RNA-binding Zn ribbon-like protein